jgi:hypothetical protein
LKHENITAYSAPALFSVSSTEATGKHIGPFSFTQGAVPSNDLLSSGFESLSFRYRFQAETDSDVGGNTVFADTSIYDQYINGLFDNGTARIYRVQNNQFTLVRKSKVTRYHSSGWVCDFISPDLLISPSSRQGTFRFPGWYGSPALIWVKIVAVAVDSKNNYVNESTESVTSFSWVSIDDGSSTVYTTAAGSLPFKLQAKSHSGDHNYFTSSHIQPPSGLSASQDSSTGLIQLRWNFPVSSERFIRGFRLYRSSWSSNAQEGFSISLQQGGIAVRKGDLVFIDAVLNSWSRKKYTSVRVQSTPVVTYYI